MKTILDKTKPSDSKMVAVQEYNVEDTMIQCDDCEIAFKSEYHLENHMKSSQHSIKTGLNRKFGYTLNHKTAKKQATEGCLQKSPG